MMLNSMSLDTEVHLGFSLQRSSCSEYMCRAVLASKPACTVSVLVNFILSPAATPLGDWVFMVHSKQKWLLDYKSFIRSSSSDQGLCHNRLLLKTVHRIFFKHGSNLGFVYTVFFFFSVSLFLIMSNVF